MGFDKVDQSVPNFPALEGDILKLWKQRRVFERSLEESRSRPEFVFYEGPPTANGLPHNGHVLTRVIKDLFPRYMTMRGYHVKRRAGWDTHGLPVEVEVEKQLRIKGKAAILDYGLDRFSKKCMQSVFRYTKEWEHLTERIGFWVNLDEAYVTYRKSYIQSVWWALSKLFDQGLLYQGHKVVWWWAQGGTALSAGEVGGSYKTVDDPSTYVRFPLKDEDASLVIWTTTPWTLPSNMFTGVHPEFSYAYARDPDSNELLVVAEALVEGLSKKIGRELTVEKTVKGSKLIGKRYTPPFNAYPDKLEDPRYYRIVPGNKASSGTPQWFVTLDAGTGLVHIAPAFGEDDWKVWRNEGQKHRDIEMFCAVRPDGTFDERLADLELEGVWVKDGDKALVKHLKQAGLLVHFETYRHEYPFCWRSSEDPLIQYARSAWFIRTTDRIDQIIENNQNVEWMPEHIKDGRFGDFLGSNVDWALSRERFWGTPLNIWVCEECDHREAPSSCAEIETKNPDAFASFAAAKEKDPELSEDLMVHKPWIDEVTFPCTQCGKTMRRVPEVIDCWFDSGCMPFAQLGYPHQKGSKAAFERSFPADFISEAIDQTRGWFYSLMAISNLVFPNLEQVHPYKRCIVLGLVLDKAGKKESKSSGNYTPPEVILDAVRMQFAPVDAEATKYAKGLTTKAGTILIAKEDLEGLDVKEGAEVLLYRGEEKDSGTRLKIRSHKKLPRRVVLMHDDDRAALGLEHGPSDVMPVEVPKLEEKQRVMVEYEGVPAPGADAFRWFFYASNPPWNNTRHSLSNVRGLQKELPIKLRNVYSFFVTYANIDHFDPVKDEDAKRPVAERALLDRWIVSELERTKLMVVQHMDAFVSYNAAQVLSEFVEALSNWYVRRSRDRFWAAGRDADKLDAYWTLYQCLRDLSILLAPFIPFAAEDMYQNLVVGPYGEGLPDSVHLRAYPTGDASRVDEQLSSDMRIVRSVVSLGLQARAKAKLKTRQPLAQAEVILPEADRREALSKYLDVVCDELNVKNVEIIEQGDDFVSYVVKPNFAALGKRLGPKMKATQKALATASVDDLRAQLADKGAITVEVDGDELVLSNEEVVIQVQAKEGFLAASDPQAVVVLDPKLTPELEAEGLFREVLSKIQARRKELALEFTDRIELGLTGAEAVMKVCRDRAEELKEETLTTRLELGADVGGQVCEISVDGDTLRMDMKVAPRPRGLSKV